MVTLYFICAWATLILWGLSFRRPIRSLLSSSEFRKNDSEGILAGVAVLGIVFALAWPISIVALSLVWALFYKEMLCKEKSQ